MVTVVSVFLFGERIKPLFVLGLGLALVGVATLALQRTGAVVTPPNCLLAASFFAAYLLIVVNVRRNTSTTTIMFHMTFVAWILFSEPLTLLMLASGAAILAGIWFCRKATMP